MFGTNPNDEALPRELSRYAHNVIGHDSVAIPPVFIQHASVVFGFRVSGSRYHAQAKDISQ
jgi:hypothetical protein